MDLFQMYDTDIWGSHASRTNIGVFSSVQEALYSLVKNPQTEEPDFDRLVAIFSNDNRLFIEKITINEVEGYSQVFDSENDDSLDELKKIIFFESVERFKNDLGFLDIDSEEIDFDINSIDHPDDVPQRVIDEFLSEENARKFIKEVFKS